MTLKLKLPAFLSRTPDPAGETVTARTVLDSDRPASQGKSRFRPICCASSRLPNNSRYLVAVWCW
jgi:hypothetical protein